MQNHLPRAHHSLRIRQAHAR